MKKIVPAAIVALLVIGAVIFLNGRVSKNSGKHLQATHADVVKIGAILPLTGSSANAAEFAKRGLEIAIKNLNITRDTGQPRLEVVYGDSKNMAKDGLTVFNKMVNLDRLKFFFATNSGVVVPLSETVGTRTDVVLMITISSAPGVAAKGPNIFRFFVTAKNEAQTMSQFLRKDKDISKVGVFFINDDFGLGGVKEFEKSFAESGGEVVWKDSWEKGKTDFKSSLFKIPKDAQALYVIGYEAGLGLAVRQARETEFQGIICTTVGMSVPPWRAAAKEAADGVFYTSTGFSPDNPEPNAVNFVKTFQELYGDKPNSFAAFAYDSMFLLGKAIQSNGDNPLAVAKTLAVTAPIQGVFGNIRFNEEGEADLPLAIWQFKDGRERLVK